MSTHNSVIGTTSPASSIVVNYTAPSRPYFPSEGYQPFDLNYSRRSFKNQHHCSGELRKTIYTFKKNLEELCPNWETHGGMLTLRFQDDLNLAQAKRCFSKIVRTLNTTFERYAGAVEFSDSGHIHIHLYVAANMDIAAGFCYEAYSRVTGYTKFGRPSGLSEKEHQTAILAEVSRLNPNPHLQQIRSRLNRLITKHGFKEVRITDIAPLLQNPTAVAQYITKNLGRDHRKFGRYVKRQRMIIAPKKNPKSYCRHFHWNTDRTREKRQCFTAIAESLGHTQDSFLHLYPKWFRVMRVLYREIKKAIPNWPGYSAPAFDAGRFFRRVLWYHFFWIDEMGPTPQSYEEYFPEHQDEVLSEPAASA